jgi:hypothetical protein
MRCLVLQFKRLLELLELLGLLEFIQLLEFIEFSFRIPQSAFRNSKVSLSRHPLIYVSFPPVPRHLPNHTLRSVLAIELWVNALAALINVETFAALLTKSRFVFLTNCDRLPIRVLSTLHLIFS